MREILFRGKTISGGKWVTGVPVPVKKAARGTDDIVLVERIDFFDFDNRFPVVAPDTIGQFTGLYDKNGKRIFEGDIVRHYCDHNDSSHYDTGTVFFNSRAAQFRRTTDGTFHHGVAKTYSMSAGIIYEIVGNIHDNPELRPEPLHQVAEYEEYEEDDEYD